jgi:hypothetical protein
MRCRLVRVGVQWLRAQREIEGARKDGAQITVTQPSKKAVGRRRSLHGCLGSMGGEGNRDAIQSLRDFKNGVLAMAKRTQWSCTAPAHRGQNK